MDKKLITLFFIILSFFTILPSKSDNIEDATVFYNEAIDLYRQDDVEKSIELFEKAIQLNPDFYEAHYNLAQILMSVNKNEEAYKLLQNILKMKPNDSETLYNLGKIQYKRGYLSSSHAYLEQIEPSAPQYDSAKLLIDKIENRQNELNLEAKIKERNNLVDAQGKAQSVELGEVLAPSGVAVDNRGNIYVASFSENAIYKISIYGQKTVYSKSALIKGPIGIAIDSENNLFVANYSVNNIVKIEPSGTASVFADIKKPYCIIYDSIHNRIYVTEQNTNKIAKFDL